MGTTLPLFVGLRNGKNEKRKPIAQGMSLTGSLLRVVQVRGRPIPGQWMAPETGIGQPFPGTARLPSPRLGNNSIFISFLSVCRNADQRARCVPRRQRPRVHRFGARETRHEMGSPEPISSGIFDGERPHTLLVALVVTWSTHSLRA